MIETRERKATEINFTAAGTSTRELTGGQALVASLIANDVDTIFALPGVQLDGAFDALYAEREAIRVIHPRHEQAAAYMADGYARTTDKVGVCMVVPGPGLLNATAALSTAYACNSPVVCVTGQIQSDLIEFGRGLLHEIPNQLGMIRSVTKHAERATTPQEIPGLVQRAFAEVRSGRPRPVEIEIPPDTLFATAEVELLPPAAIPERPAGDPEALEQAAHLLSGARRPLIWSGGGVLRSGAWNELRRVAERLQAPVIMTANGKGAISDRDPLAHNILGGMELLREADVVFAVGTRFVDPATAKWGVSPEQTIIQLDIDSEEIARNLPVSVGIEADARAGLGALADILEREGSVRPNRTAELEELKRGVAARARAVGVQAEYALAIREALPDDGIFVSEMTQVGYWSNFAFPVYEPRTYITPGYQGTLGYGFPTSLGAKIAHPDRAVVSINGDGGFGFCLNELATMALHGIAAIAIVFTDDAFGNVRPPNCSSWMRRTLPNASSVKTTAIAAIPWSAIVASSFRQKP
ncbi:MAG TPA: thiamine pyrophosphate-binding protein, partial [Thermomicrobiales bacterium]|nr:thiamine pyrophosphate-binding protein [Thermomicrobiales bacterium]